jgi:hypothetical protein
MTPNPVAWKLRKVAEDEHGVEKFSVLRVTHDTAGQSEAQWAGAERELSLDQARIEALALGVTSLDFTYALTHSRQEYAQRLAGVAIS